MCIRDRCKRIPETLATGRCVGMGSMMNTDLEAKEKRMLELEGVLSSNQSTDEERDLSLIHI